MNQPEEIKLLRDAVESALEKLTRFQIKGWLASHDKTIAKCKQALEKTSRTPDAATKELLQDKARLDWFKGRNLQEVIDVITDNGDGKNLRTAIDTAMREDKS